MKDINIKKIVDQAVNEMFRGTDKTLVNEDTNYVTRAKKDLVNSFQKYYNQNKGKTAKRAKNVGIDINKGSERKAYTDNMLSKHGSYENALKQMSPEIKGAIDAMLKIKDPNTSPEERKELSQKYGGFSGLQRYRDILDKLSLTPAYDQERASEAGIEKAPFNTNYKLADGSLSQKKIGGVTGFDYENLDLTAVSDRDIMAYFRDGTRKNHNLDEDPNNPTYGELSNMAKGGDKNALDVLKNLYFKAEFNKVMNSKFGYDFKMPGAMYTYGNSKLPNDTLVINFTSAHRCPAWNECLVGYACYARGSEHNYEGLHKKNSNLHLMWLSTNDDPEMMASMQRLIKMYLVNPEEMAGALLKNERTSGKWIDFLTNGKTTFSPINKATNKAMEMPADAVLDMKEEKSLLGMVLEDMETEAVPQKKQTKLPPGARANLASYIYNNKWSDIFSEEDINAIMANPKSFRAKFIRLNEEGDFIGQWLLDAIDEFAGELKLLGISTAAYTCRYLDFRKIKNIILNASTIDVGTKGEKEGETSNAIARRFFAVSEQLYDSLEDTYVPNGNKFNYTPNQKNGYDGKTPIIPLHRIGDKWAVKYDLKPYALDGNTTPVQFNDTHDPNGPVMKNRMYYKCPCGRYGDQLVNGKPIKMDCYLCRMCYEPKNQDVGELYVLVKVHGDNIDSFNMGRANAARGINDTMTTYKEARTIFGNRLSEMTQMSEKEGMRIVSENGINSVKAHLAEIADSEVMSMQNESKKFSDIIMRMNEAEKKRKKETLE